MHPFDRLHQVAFVDVRVLETIVIAQLEIVFFGQSVLRIVVNTVPARHPEHVNEPRIGNAERRGIIGEQSVRILPFHFCRFLLGRIRIFSAVHHFDAVGSVRF